MKQRIPSFILLLWTITVLPCVAETESTLDLEGTSIIGEQEAPQVRFTIPWRETRTTTLPRRPWTSLITHEPRPLDRETFLLQLQLEQLIRPNELPR